MSAIIFLFIIFHSEYLFCYRLCISFKFCNMKQMLMKTNGYCIYARIFAFSMDFLSSKSPTDMAYFASLGSLKYLEKI